MVKIKKKRKPSNMKGMTIGGGQKRPTKSGAGMTAKGVANIEDRIPDLN